MNKRPKLLGAAIVSTLIISSGLVGFAQPTAGATSRVDRLVALGKLWAAVKYFHPYIAYRDDIDWDGALVRAIPRVDAARDNMEYSAAVEGMLKELGDPVTRVLDIPEHANSSPPAERQPSFRMNADGILVVSMTNYSDFLDFVGTGEKLEALKKALPKARALILDLRPSMTPSELEKGLASFAISDSGLAGALTTVSLEMPGERRRMHDGFAPQDGSATGGYSSGFYVQGRQPIKPASGAKDTPVVFVVSAGAGLPEMALGFQASGRGAIVSEGISSEDVAVSTQTVELPDGVRAQIRLGELVYGDGTGGFAPDLTVAASSVKGEQNPAFQAAVQLAMKGRFFPPSHPRLPARSAPMQDNAYDNMQYPAVEYRVLAAFRIWAVMNYFYPYKDLMGDDWNETLRQIISRMEGARDALEYNLSVAEMVTHIHDTHGFIVSPVLRKHFGEASAPLRVRMIEGSPVVTGFTNTEAAKEAGFAIGDVILKVDGEDANQRIERRLKVMAHSTPQSGMFYATERSLVRGPKNSVAIFTVRDSRAQVREVRVARKEEFIPQTQGDRNGDVMRVLPGNIGYADLDRLTIPQVEEMFEKFKNCPAIIFDDRGYPNGTAWQIAPRLTDKIDVPAALYRRYGTGRALTDGVLWESQVVETFFQRLPRTDKWRYHGTTVMLIDERTISQAEHTGLFFEAANGTKFIGSPTQGTNGDVTNLAVPGGIYVNFTGQGVWHADGRQLQRLGLQPDVEVRPTLAGIRAGRDEVLEKALQYLDHRNQ